MGIALNVFKTTRNKGYTNLALTAFTVIVFLLHVCYFLEGCKRKVDAFNFI